MRNAHVTQGLKVSDFVSKRAPTLTRAVARKIPDWADAVVITEDMKAYPVLRSKYGNGYYTKNDGEKNPAYRAVDVDVFELVQEVKVLPFIVDREGNIHVVDEVNVSRNGKWLIYSVLDTITDREELSIERFAKTYPRVSIEYDLRSEIIEEGWRAYESFSRRAERNIDTSIPCSELDEEFDWWRIERGLCRPD